jgi:hypothetical protein
VMLRLAVLPSDFEFDRRPRVFLWHPQWEGLRIFADHDGGAEWRCRSGGAERSQNPAAGFIRGHVLVAPSIDILGLNSIVWNAAALIQPLV